jgi:hypothetical protein
MFYLTLLPVLIAIPLIALLPGKSGITPKRLGILLSWHLYHIHFMTGPGFLSILQLGSPSGITGLTGGPAYWEVQALSSLRKPNRRTCSPYPARVGICHGLLHPYQKSDTLICFRFLLGYDRNLLDGFPSMGPNRCSTTLDMVVCGLAFSYGLRSWALDGTKNT